VLEPDFFNNASAVLPILLLTKVADRTRRLTLNKQAASLRSHRAFIVVALAGEAAALTAALAEGTRSWVVGPLLLAMVICGAVFADELLRADRSEDRRTKSGRHG
jgi:hypothetical protein